MSTAKVISLSLPPEMEKEVQKIAKAEHRWVVTKTFKTTFKWFQGVFSNRYQD